jgi:hypothetical protein
LAIFSVASDFVTLLVDGQQREQARDAAIAVAERMDAKKIQHQRADGDERRDVILINGVAIDEAKFIHGSGRGFGGNAFETDDGCFAGPEFDDFVIKALELTGVAAAILAKFVETAQQVGSDLQFFGFGVDEVQRAAIAGDFLFRTVFGAGVAENERAQTVGGDGDAFDAVGGFDALDDGSLAERLVYIR